MKSVITALFLTAAFAANASEKFQLSSPDIVPGKALSSEQEYAGFGCKGPNVSPALNWKSAPRGTKSYAVTMYDHDAPTGSGWWHWIVINIPAKVSGLASNAGNPAHGLLPAGATHRRNDFGAEAYGGACPPPGSPAHHYTVKVFALDIEHLDVPQEGSAALVGYMLNQHALATAELPATYKR